MFRESELKVMAKLKPLRIEPTLDTPSVILDVDKNIIELAGKSFPADVTAFYKPVVEWILEYMKEPNPLTILDLKLDYFNTASSKILLDLLYKFEDLYKKGNNTLIRWHYPDDDEDMEETGAEYSEIVKVPFEHIGYTVLLK